MTLKHIALTILTALLTGMMATSAPVSLDSCRAMALANNKSLRQADLRVESAGYQVKQASAAYKPNLDFEGGYIYTSRRLALVNSDQLLPVKTFDLASQSYQFGLVTNPATGQPIQVNGQYVPQSVALLPKSALTFNIHNVFAGALTLTQPIYMGGKIRAMNKLARYNVQLEQTLRQREAEEVVYSVDEAYWQVVSLVAKQRLARSYVELVESLDADVQKMLTEGVATRANLLSVDVKLNEARVDLTKVDNGVVLARMLLAQVCGLPVDTHLELADEAADSVATPLMVAATDDMERIYGARADMKALSLATDMQRQQVRVARSEMLPQVAAVAAYHFTNPNSYNGFENRFGGAFSIGAMVKVPLWHWGGISNKVKQAEVDARLSRLALDEARDKVALQVSQARFRYQEAFTTLSLTRANLAKADENLRIAQVAFREGVSTTDEVMTAQTAWLKASSDNIDAQIDVRLCEVYLAKVTGVLPTGY